MEWLVTGREPLNYSRRPAEAARKALGFWGLNAVECLPRVIQRMPDLLAPDSELGRVMAVLLRKREAK